MWLFIYISQGEQNGEEGNFFQGDIRLMPYDDPYNLYNQIHKRMAFDREGSGVGDLEYISPRLWPYGRIPYRYSSELRECCTFWLIIWHWFCGWGEGREKGGGEEEGRREKGVSEDREGGRKEGREGGKKKGREGGRKGGREEGREEGREKERKKLIGKSDTERGKWKEQVLGGEEEEERKQKNSLTDSSFPSICSSGAQNDVSRCYFGLAARYLSAFWKNQRL